MSVEEAIEEAKEAVEAIANDSSKFSQEESVEIFKGVASECRSWADTIQEEIDGE